MRFLILGAGGFSKEIADLVAELGHDVVAFYDENQRAGATHGSTGLPIVSDTEGLPFDAAALAIGDTSARERLWKSFSTRIQFPTLVHPSACLSPSAHLGTGCLVLQNVVVNADARVGFNTILNVSCCLAHDVEVGSHCHIAPAVQIAGGGSVGDGCFCGTGTVVLPGITVGIGSVTGAGAVITSDVGPHKVAFGVPAREIRDTPRREGCA